MSLANDVVQIQCDGSPDEVYASFKPAVEAILSDAKRLAGN